MSAAPERDPELAEAVKALSATVESLRADVRRLGAAPLPSEQPAPTSVSHAWLETLEAPRSRRPSVPRFLLEALFLAACAAAAALADLDAVAIGAVMLGAWLLVALIEWAASRADRRRDELRYAPPPPLPVPEPAAPGPDPAWFAPPVEHTLLDAGAESATSITRLPPRETEIEATVEQRPS